MKKGDCIGCGAQDTWIANVWRKLCIVCNRNRLEEGKPKKKPKRYVRKPTGEREVFLEIWEEREHRCSNCRCPLGDAPLVQYFSHRKSKKQFPKLRLEKSNIDLHCFQCHYLRDHGTQEQYAARTNLYKN